MQGKTYEIILKMILRWWFISGSVQFLEINYLIFKGLFPIQDFRHYAAHLMDHVTNELHRFF